MAVATHLLGGDQVTRGSHGDSVPAALLSAEPICVAEPIAPPARLADSLLAIYADALDDMERVRIANENRVRALRQTKGMGDSPEADRLDTLIDQLKALEHGRVLELQRAVRAHPFGPWQQAQCGVGAKQLGRLLACIGDPYWHRLYDRPRTVSELWAFCGLHVLHPGHIHATTHELGAGVESSVRSDQRTADTHRLGVGPDSLPGDPDQHRCETQVSAVGVAAKRARGQKANWSADAKMRAYLIAISCVKAPQSPYRAVYDARRAVTADRVHGTPCPRCGPAGHPAPVGSPWSKGHQHADALRIVSKEILRQMWLEGRRLHDEERDRG